ncbi:RNA methyltransferase [uncultured Cohaesibacter sp.]|uniref:RNA methyltransferase n=1 Tax=uncultured Cohaesibacter sp. TaxID=1002546 RepID=UPI0029C7F79B|nr:RNA methyltransferase [uncultured Cohaesibacter sp.]
MAYDEEVAARMRDGLIGLPDVREVKMMGGVCFLLSGNMVGGVFNERADRERAGVPLFMFRVGKENVPEALALPDVSHMINGQRRMNGFVRIAAEECSDDDLATLISMSVSFVGSLPPKAGDQSHE